MALNSVKQERFSFNLQRGLTLSNHVTTLLSDLRGERQQKQPLTLSTRDAVHPPFISQISPLPYHFYRSLLNSAGGGACAPPPNTEAESFIR